MDLSAIRTEYIFKQRKLSNDIDDFIEYAINYDELLDFYGEKSEIDLYVLEWDNVQDERYFDILMKESWIIERIIDTIEKILEAGDDNKKKHRLKQSLDSFISSIRKMKKESNEFIEKEQRLLSSTNEALKILDDIRKN